ncbi:MAG: hypothetical protein RIQ33_372 [Bacteroidota bacterium]|jgi:hypothetical protein
MIENIIDKEFLSINFYKFTVDLVFSENTTLSIFNQFVVYDNNLKIILVWNFNNGIENANKLLLNNLINTNVLKIEFIPNKYIKIFFKSNYIQIFINSLNGESLNLKIDNDWVVY